MSMKKILAAQFATGHQASRAFDSLRKIQIGALILFLSLVASAQGAGLEGSKNPLAEFLQNGDAFQAWVDGLKPQQNRKDPPPPQLPRRFRWTGRYVVPDLIDPRTGKRGITVPFVWWGENGNTQMIAGGPNDPIYFTNFIIFRPPVHPHLEVARPGLLPSAETRRQVQHGGSQ
jgi:hypothetical protein